MKTQIHIDAKEVKLIVTPDNSVSAEVLKLFKPGSAVAVSRTEAGVVFSTDLSDAKSDVRAVQAHTHDEIAVDAQNA